MYLKQFFERLYYHPKGYGYFIILILFPFSLFYGIVMFLRRILTPKRHFDIPVVSVGNLIVGGSGKTPFVITLANRYENVAIVSRGYGRMSSGLLVVSEKGKILTTVAQSGDEAMLMARMSPDTSVIVSEDRRAGIEEAIHMGADVVILDDGFNRIDIKKYEILLEPASLPNRLPFPAGPYREFGWTKRFADMVLKEGDDFVRKVEIEEDHRPLLLVTAIANPDRLTPYLPNNVVGSYLLEDHAYFDESILQEKMQDSGAEALLVTQKDAVKMEGFKLPVVEMKLKLEIKEEALSKIDAYIFKYQGKQS